MAAIMNTPNRMVAPNTTTRAANARRLLASSRFRWLPRRFIISIPLLFDSFLLGGELLQSNRKRFFDNRVHFLPGFFADRLDPLPNIFSVSNSGLIEFDRFLFTVLHLDHLLWLVSAINITAFKLLSSCFLNFFWYFFDAIRLLFCFYDLYSL